MPVLDHIFNLCLQSRVVKTAWKTATIKPLPKVKQPALCVDFRPVSILNVLSKTLEKVVHNQLYDFVTLNEI